MDRPSGWVRYNSFYNVHAPDLHPFSAEKWLETISSTVTQLHAAPTEQLSLEITMSLVYTDNSKLDLVFSEDLTGLLKVSVGPCWATSTTEHLGSPKCFITAWVQLGCHILLVHMKCKLEEELLHCRCCLTSSSARSWPISMLVQTLVSKRWNLRWIDRNLESMWRMEGIAFKCQWA